MRLALKAKGVERTFLVTDMIAGAGLGAGDYTLGGQIVHVDATTARLADGTLAGSVLTMDQAVRNIVNLAEATIAEACRMASGSAGAHGRARRARAASLPAATPTSCSSTKSCACGPPTWAAVWRSTPRLPARARRYGPLKAYS